MVISDRLLVARRHFQDTASAWHGLRTPHPSRTTRFAKRVRNDPMPRHALDEPHARCSQLTRCDTLVAIAPAVLGAQWTVRTPSPATPSFIGCENRSSRCSDFVLKVCAERSFLAHPWAILFWAVGPKEKMSKLQRRPKARDTHPQRKNFKATAKLTTLQISMLPSSQPSELKVAPSNMTLRMASIKGVSGRIRR